MSNLKGYLAKLGFTTAAAGSAAILAFSAGSDLDAPNRTGWYADIATSGSEHLGLVAGGVESARALTTGFDVFGELRVTTANGGELQLTDTGLTYKPDAVGHNFEISRAGHLITSRVSGNHASFRFSRGTALQVGAASDGTTRGYLLLEDDHPLYVTIDGTDVGRFLKTQLSIDVATASTDPTTGALVVTGGVGIGGKLFIGDDTSIDGKLTVTGLIDPTGLQFDAVAANPGDALTLWVDSTNDDTLMFGATPVIGGGGGDFVQKSGDTMTGPLIVDADDEVDNYSEITSIYINFEKNVSTFDYELRGNGAGFITLQRDGMLDRRVIINQELRVTELENHSGEIVTVDNNGTFQVSGTTLADIDGNISGSIGTSHVAYAADTNELTGQSLFTYTYNDIPQEGGLFIGNTTPSTNATTGALVVSGGLGVGGGINAGDTVSVHFPHLGVTDNFPQAFSAVYDGGDTSNPIKAFVANVMHGSGSANIAGFDSTVFSFSSATVHAFKGVAECDNGVVYGAHFNAKSANVVVPLYGVYAEVNDGAATPEIRQHYAAFLNGDTRVDGYLYLGAKNTDGSWRFGRTGNNTVFQRQEDGSWVTKMTVEEDTNIATLNQPQTFTAGQAGEITPLVDGATVAIDLADSNHFSLTIGGNRTLDNPANVTPGQSGMITVTQDATGSRVLSFASNWSFADGVAPVLSTAGGAVDALAYFVISNTSILISIAESNIS